jgi:SAM-dependent MidA family methyltransferase
MVIICFGAGNGHMESIEKLMERTNTRYYSGRGKHIYFDFKTFAASRKLGRACALEFIEKAQKAEGELRVYEFGVGDGSFARNFLESLEKIDSSVGKRVNYVLWDLSKKMLDEAQENLRGYPIEAVCRDAENLSGMKEAFWVRGNEILDDIPARVFLREGKKIYEVGWNNGEFAAWEEPRAPAEAIERMAEAPEGYWITLNLRAKKIMEGWKGQIAEGGGISIFEYGFYSMGELQEVPAEIWNDSVVREYGGQYTVDVDFGWLEKKCGGSVEGQDGFVRRTLGEDVFAVEMEKLDYVGEKDVERKRRLLEKEGYDIELLKRGAEKNPFYHYTWFR